MASVTILAGHPFFEIERPAVWHQSWNGKWTVRWRDFKTMKQDAEFDTEQEARAFAERVNRPPLLVEDDDGEVAEADAFWRQIARQNRNATSPK